MVRTLTGRGSPLETGQLAEDQALRHLAGAGLQLLQRNYRVARGPGARAGEIDLIFREPDGTVVFVEVRSRSQSGYGSALESIGPRKRERVVRAATLYLQSHPAAARGNCRFDVVAIDGPRVQWLRGAFGATD